MWELNLQEGPGEERKPAHRRSRGGPGTPRRHSSHTYCIEMERVLKGLPHTRRFLVSSVSIIPVVQVLTVRDGEVSRIFFSLNTSSAKRTPGQPPIPKSPSSYCSSSGPPWLGGCHQTPPRAEGHLATLPKVGWGRGVVLLLL